MRCAITIIYNGIHHLKHGDFIDRMLDIFDYWIIVEGHALPNGSTAWCKKVPMPSASSDGTREYLKMRTDLLCSNFNNQLHYIPSTGYWESKDAQFQAGIEKLKTLTNSCTLWQVDVDEWWTIEQIEKNEAQLTAKAGAVSFDHVVGTYHDDLLVARGAWGSDFVNRVWRWNGEDFATHEPAQMVGQGQPQKLTEKFLHFSYYFEQDIIFKEQYYGYQNLHKHWQALQRTQKFPAPIHTLFGRHPIGRTDTKIYRLRRETREGRVLLRSA